MRVCEFFIVSAEALPYPLLVFVCMVDVLGNHLHYACHPHEVVIFSAVDSGQIPRLLVL